jgi:hypothetical protein
MLRILNIISDRFHKRVSNPGALEYLPGCQILQVNRYKPGSIDIQTTDNQIFFIEFKSSELIMDSLNMKKGEYVKKVYVTEYPLRELNIITDLGHYVLRLKEKAFFNFLVGCVNNPQIVFD